jgi:hypothetical protein
VLTFDYDGNPTTTYMAASSPDSESKKAAHAKERPRRTPQVFKDRIADAGIRLHRTKVGRRKKSISGALLLNPRGQSTGWRIGL